MNADNPEKEPPCEKFSISLPSEMRQWLKRRSRADYSNNVSSVVRTLLLPDFLRETQKDDSEVANFPKAPPPRGQVGGARGSAQNVVPTVPRGRGVQTKETR